ncbi:MAG: hypothetical protein ACE5G9_06855 [Nitrospinales bacterium]
MTLKLKGFKSVGREGAMLSAASLLLLSSASVAAEEKPWVDTLADNDQLITEITQTASQAFSGEGEMPVEHPEVEAADPLKGGAYFGKQFKQRLLDLGAVEHGEPKFEVLERNLIAAQVKTFIPPLLVPAGNPVHAFTLPPGLWALATSLKFTTITPTDFRSNGQLDTENYINRSVNRLFFNLTLKRGFDLNRKFLHSWVAIVNVPYQFSQARGSVLLNNIKKRNTSAGPGNGFAFNTIVNNGGTAEGLGDVSLFLKKKIWDQANHPVGLAVAAGVFFPTGSNDEKAGDDGRITIRCEGSINPTGFGSLKPDGTARGEAGTGCPPSFRAFRIGSGLGPLDNFDENGNKLFTQNGQLLRPPGFRRPVFKRFTDDGRLPIGLQPGKGTFSYQVAGFLSKQFVPGDMPNFLAGTPFDRSALHIGGIARFNFESDGVDAGNTYKFVANYVVPVYKDYVSLQFSSINILQKADSYRGNFALPGSADFVSNVKTGQPPPQGSFAPARKTFRHGWTNLIGPGIVYSPDPVIRMTANALVRVSAPSQGPSPHLVILLGTAFVF